MNIVCPVDVASQPGEALPDQQITNAALAYLSSRATVGEGGGGGGQGGGGGSNDADGGVGNDGATHSTESNRTRKGGTPMFLAVGYHKPHIPLKFPAKFLDMIPTDAVSLASFKVYGAVVERGCVADA